MPQALSLERRAGIQVGSLFLLTLVAGGLNAYLFDPILSGPLEAVFPSRREVLIGFFLMLSMSAGLVGIALSIFPILARHSRTAALAYLSFRSIECALLSAGAACSLVILALSRRSLQAGASEDPHLAFLATLVLDTRYVGYQIAMIFLGICSIPMCLVLLRHRRVPGPIALLGIVGYLCLFASGILDLMGLVDTVHGKGALLYIPGGLFEGAALPIWLLAKGFTPAARPAS